MPSKISIIIVSFVLLSSLVFLGQNFDFASSENIGGNVIVNDDPTGMTFQSLPDVAVDKNGKIHVVWLDERDASKDVRYSNSTNGGVSFDASIKVDDADAGIYSIKATPQIVVDNNGKIHIAWFHHNGADYSIYVANSTDSGQSFKTNPAVVDNLTATQLAPDIDVYGANDVYVVWMDGRNGDSDVYFTKSTDSGTSYGMDVMVNDDGGSTLQSYPHIAVDSNGAIHSVWEDSRDGDYDIYYARSTDGGDSFEPNKKIAGGSGTNQTESYITVDNRNNIYVSYTNNSGTFSNINLVKSINGGDSWTAPVKVNDNIANVTQTFSSVAVNSTGKIFTVFEDNRSYPDSITTDIYISNSTNGGTSFGADDIVNNDTGSNNHFIPKVTIAPDDTVYIVWADDRSSYYDIYLAKIQGESAVNNPPNIISMVADPTIADPGGSSNITVTASDLDGDPLTYHYEATGGNFSGTGANVTWNAPLIPGVYNITAWVSDGKANSGTEMVNVTVKAGNKAPIMDNITADKFAVGPGGESNITVTAHDPDSDPLTYYYETTGGDISGAGPAVKWVGPEINGKYKITAWVSDGLLESKNLTINITVSEGTQFNTAPVITNLEAVPAIVEPEGVSDIKVTASDVDGDTLTYNYTVTGGVITGTGPNVTWTAPNNIGEFTVTAWANDGMEDSNKESINITVREISSNHAPVVTSITADPTTVGINGTSNITVVASDEDGDELTYNYTVTGGVISGTGPGVSWMAPNSNGVFEVSVSVFDGLAESNSMGVNITVTGGDNTAPVLVSITAEKMKVFINESVKIDVVATDADGDTLTYIYIKTGGEITGSGASVTWKAPETAGTYTITAKVNDGTTDSNSMSVDIKVSLKFLPNGSAAPDLVINDADIKFSDDKPEEDQNITITVTVHNDGSDTATNVSVDVYSNTSLVGTKYIPKIDPEGSESVVFNYHFSQGEFRVEAKADEDNHITELDETNNDGKKDILVYGKGGGGGNGTNGNGTNGNGTTNGGGKDGKDDDEKESTFSPLFIILPIIIVVVIILLFLFVIQKKKPESAAPAEEAVAEDAKDAKDAEDAKEADEAETETEEPAAPEPAPVAPEPAPAEVPAAPTPAPTPTPAPAPAPEPAPVTPEPVPAEPVKDE